MEIVLNIDEKFENEYSEYELKMIIAVSLYEKGILDSGAAADAIGVDYTDFIMEMGKYGESIFDMSEEEIEREVKNAEKFVA